MTHLHPDGKPRFVNRLARERSPYLLQHAHNPVDWYPWGDEAFAKARDEGKLVVLSVGYATCHWCHVMEHESFEDLEIAAFLNAHYVAVKVDREERPDVDAIYMAVVQATTGRGGWPMTVFLTPNREPVLAGSYFPPRDGVRGAALGFLTLLRRLADVYQSQGARMATEATALVERLSASLALPPAALVPTNAGCDRAVALLMQQYDAAYGGFGRGTKFPRPASLRLLARRALRTREPGLQAMLTRTLDAMAAGGLRDHLGGGFHRYAVDAQWHVPHFEKMLYDNAQLAVTYLEGYELCREPRYAELAQETVAATVALLGGGEGGGFYAAADADSLTPNGELQEGYYFTWTPAEVVEHLSTEEAALVASRYCMGAPGEVEGRNVLRLPWDPDATTQVWIEPQEPAHALWTSARGKLLAARSRRSAPRLDTKLLSSGNGLMLSALARVGRACSRADFLERAQQLAALVARAQAQGGLRRTLAGPSVGAFLDDYANVIGGLLDLFVATAAPQALTLAVALQRELDERFWDHERGGYFLTAEDAEKLLWRDKPDYDGAEPAGNSQCAHNLWRLELLTGESHYGERLRQLASAFAVVLAEGWRMPALHAALDDADHAARLTVVERYPGAGDALLAVAAQTFRPSLLVVRVSASALEPLAQGLAELRGPQPEAAAVAHLCAGERCYAPVTQPLALQELLTHTQGVATLR